MTKPRIAIACLAALLTAAACSPSAPPPPADATSAQDTPPVARIDNTVFISGVYGTAAEAADQVEEVVQQADAQLAQQGLGIGAMVQHTIFVKDGAVSPGTVLQRFHAEATRLAPGLAERKSVGTIIRVPDMPGNAAVMLELVAAGTPGEVDDFERIPFTFGPQEIAETIRVGDLVYTAGTEAADFEHGTVPSGIDAQMEAVVGKLDAALGRAGLTLADMITHNLYVRKDVDPLHVIEKFHELTHARAPGLKDAPSIGTLALVDGMAGDTFLIEMDAIAAVNKGDNIQRVLFDTPLPIARAVSAGDFVFLSGDTGEEGGADIDSQIDTVVAKFHDTLQQAGLSIGNIVKARFYLANGAADPDHVSQRFREAVVKLAPEAADKAYAETMVLTEGVDQEGALAEFIVIASRQ